MEKLLEVNNLSVSYFTYAGEVQSVRGISFDVKKGKTTALVGESGCGKSVTAKSLMGLIEKPGKVSPESKISYQGKEITGYTEKEWNRFRGKECSMVFQDALVSLNPTMKIGKQIAENLKNHESGMSKEEIRKKSLEMLKLTGVPDPEGCMNKYPHELSGGMRQRVMIASAMVTHPQLLIADEPTTALDVTIQAQIIALMEELQEKLEMSIIIITHDLGVVADMADEIIVMYAGEIVERGTARDIFYHQQHPYTWALLQSVPRIDSADKSILNTIEGNIPDMIKPPKGCSFCSRCPYAMEICQEEKPETVQITKEHSVACWLMDECADRSDVPFGRIKA